MGYDIKKIALLPLSKLDELAKKISNQSLPLKEWGDNLQIIQGEYTHRGNQYGTEIHFGDLKQYITKDYSWLYSTTYWNSSTYLLSETIQAFVPNRYYVFTAEQGKLCGAGFAACAPETALGCGIRPVVTISNNNLKYLIKTITDENGTIEVVDSALGNDTVQFKVTAKSGYKLNRIMIKTDSGETIELKEGEIQNNSDGTISIDKNNFIMPFENITIEAKWEPNNIIDLPEIITNPKTGDKAVIITALMSLSIITGLYTYRKKLLR